MFVRCCWNVIAAIMYVTEICMIEQITCVFLQVYIAFIFLSFYIHVVERNEIS